MLIAYVAIAFVSGAGIASGVAVWLWPDKPAAPAPSTDSACHTSGLAIASIDASEIMRAAGAKGYYSTFWYTPRRRSSCSAPSQRLPQRDSRGRFCSRRRGAARDSQ